MIKNDKAGLARFLESVKQSDAEELQACMLRALRGDPPTARDLFITGQPMVRIVKVPIHKVAWAVIFELTPEFTRDNLYAAARIAARRAGYLPVSDITVRAAYKEWRGSPRRGRPSK
jgi:hypothetical protein